MTLTIAIRRPSPRVDPAAVRGLAEAFSAFAAPLAKRHGVPVYADVSITFLGDRDISRIHEEALGVGGTTDVITLPYAPAPGIPASAEIFINTALACSRGRNRTSLELVGDESNRTWSPAHELALYLAHGFDHLAGNVDHTTAGFTAMRKREIKWVEKAFSLGIAKNLFSHKE